MKNRLRLAFGILLGAISLGIVPATTVTEARASMNDYVRGYNKGWSDGWKKVKGAYFVAPQPPYPAYPPSGGDNYNNGYSDGLLAGVAAAQN